MLSKKWLKVVLVLCLLISLLVTGCSNSAKQQQPQENNKTEEKAQENTEDKFPEKEIRLIVYMAAGGGTDLCSRAIARGMEEYLKVPVVVENMEGGGGAVGMQAVMTAKPDGYTIGTAGNQYITFKYTKQSEAHMDNLQIISVFNFDPNAMVVPANSPYKTMKDLVEAAKKKPGTITAGHSGTGSSWYLGLIGWQDIAGMTLKEVPFNGAAEQLTALAGTQVDVSTSSLPEAKSLIEAGKVRALGVAAEQRDPNYPDVPTFKEEGFDFVYGTIRELYGPKGIPAERIKKLDEAVKYAMNTPEVKKFFKESGFAPLYLSTDDAKKFFAGQAESFEKLLQKVGLAK